MSLAAGRYAGSAAMPESMSDELAPEAPILLDWEDPATTDPADAHHWIRIYDELIQFKLHLIERARDGCERMSPAARPGALGEVAVLEDQLRRLEGRRAFWVARQAELRGVHMDPGSRTLSYGGNQVTLTGREFEVITTLLRNAGRAVPARRLLVEAWGDAALTAEQLRLYISRLRVKLADIDGLEIAHQRQRGYSLMFRDGAGPE